MAVDARAIQNVGPSADLSPALGKLQLAFSQGILSGQEIADSLIVNPSRQAAQRARNLAEVDLAPLRAEAETTQLEGQIASAPAQRELADLQLQNQLGAAQAQADIQPGITKAQQLEVQNQVAQLEGFLGAQPFAKPENATSFFQSTRPGEKIPEDPAMLAQKNRETFNAIQQFKLESQRFGGKQTTESFTRVNPETFDKERVRVTFDGAGNVIREESLGLVEAGAKSLTEQQANAVQFSARMKQAVANLDALEDAGFDPAGIVNHLGQTASRMKLGILSSTEAQQYEAAKRNWMAAVLRKESGAAIAQSEYRGADHQYFPQPGDKPEVIAQKRQLREAALNTMQAAGLFGLPPAQQSIIKDKFSSPAVPTLSEIKARHEVKPDSEFDEDDDTPGGVPTPSGVEEPAAGLEIPTVSNAAEAQQLPATVQFFQAPDGRVFKNPNFQ